VGIQRLTADIGGFKIIALGVNGFTVDDFTFGGAPSTTVPETNTLTLLVCGMLACGLLAAPKILRSDRC